MTRKRAWAIVAGVVALCAPHVVAQDAAKDPSPDAAAQESPAAEEPSIAELTERIGRSVVTITSSNRDGAGDNVGTGFVISSDGLIATNHHVIGEGRQVRIQFADGRKFDATAVHASDRELDLAVLKIAGEDLPALELGDAEEVRQGQSVVALGNPAGLKHSVVSGVVSAVREIDGRSMIQVAIPIEPGNSGGPLVDRQGRVLGVLTMKSLVTPNLGFAVSINLLKLLLEKPNPIPMSRWLTIGALDPREWKPILGARWRQRAGRIRVTEPGRGFGGRSLCLWQMDVPEFPVEVAVAVRLDDESGAAGLAFCSDGGQRHFAFYPSGGHLRLTRFEGPDIRTWTILFDSLSEHYLPGDWNTLRVRLEDGLVSCFVNDEQVVQMPDRKLSGGQVGLVKFRNTGAQFKKFRLGRELPPSTVPPEEIERIVKLVEDLPEAGPLDRAMVASLSTDSASATRVLRDRAAELDRRASRLRELADATHERRVIADLTEALSAPEEQIDLFRAGLLVAKLDNEEVDVDAYVAELTRMTDELRGMLPKDPDDKAKLDTLKKYLFAENGFHGSRGEYYNRANSYLNEVLDDREGLPITLSVVYLELGRRIGLKLEGVGLPGHFVVRYVPEEGEGTLFDVFDGAVEVSREEANRRVKAATERELTDDDLRATSKRAIIARMLHNLLGVAGPEPDKLLRYLNAILAVEPESPQHRWLRAIVRYRLEDRAGATEDVDWLVANKPAGIDLVRVLALQRSLRQAAEEGQ